jgi:hypothetical protein
MGAYWLRRNNELVDSRQKKGMVARGQFIALAARSHIHAISFAGHDPARLRSWYASALLFKHSDAGYAQHLDTAAFRGRIMPDSLFFRSGTNSIAERHATHTQKCKKEAIPHSTRAR